MKSCLAKLMAGDTVHYRLIGSITPRIVNFQYWDIYPIRMVGAERGRGVIFATQDMLITKIIKKKNVKDTSHM